MSGKACSRAVTDDAIGPASSMGAGDRLDNAVLLDKASFCYVDESERLDGETVPEAKGASGSRVDDISFAVATGTCTVLCGRSGDGKSTVLRMIDGLAGTFFPGDLEGVVAVCGTDVRSLSARDRTSHLGVVMQDPRSQFFMGTVGDEIAFSAENLGVAPDETICRVRRAAAICGVEELLGEKLSELSSGQKQRVALAAAIACDPKVLVLDEPTSNLDMQGSDALVGILADLKQAGVAIVVSEHRLHQLVQVADEYVCMREGRIAARWNADRFLALSVEETARFGLRHPAMTCDVVASAANECGTAGADDIGGENSGNRTADAAVPPSAGLPSGAARGDWVAEGLTYAYPSTKRGIRALTAAFAQGAVTVVEGENGAGKTTLAKVLCGAVKEQSGRVTRGGVPASRRERRRASYFVMQDADYQLYAGSVADEVVLGRKIDDALKTRVWEALAAFGLTGLADRHPASLSGGQKQRVTLAAAYCSDAELIVLDEPTSGLDGRGVAEVASWCKMLARTGKTVVVITHDMLLARLAGDAVVRLGS